MKEQMKKRYRLVRRKLRGGTFYCVDNNTGKRTSLKTADEDAACQIVEAKNLAERQPHINRQIAKAYLAAADSNFISRVWQEVMTEFLSLKTGSNHARTQTAIADKALDSIRQLQLLETRPEHFLRVLRAGKVSTNSYLRRIHNFAVDMGWLPWPVMPKRQWPAIRYREKRAITKDEHELILSRETNAEMQAFLRCCWHIGGAQSDVAHLQASDIDWQKSVISFFRSKTGTAQIIHYGPELASVLSTLPKTGALFPRLGAMDEKHRASLFQRAYRRVKVTGVSLHSYRYAWAERARKCGYPQRFAQEALGHNSKAVHAAYAKKAEVRIPSLEQWERQMKEKIVQLEFPGGKSEDPSNQAATALPEMGTLAK
jgi:integrase